jgi:hypothetical protein
VRDWKIALMWVFFIWYSALKSPCGRSFVVLIKRAVIFLSNGVNKYLIALSGDICAAVLELLAFKWTEHLKLQFFKNAV